jgi:hypothetical protein
MRGADLEKDDVLLDHLVEHLARASRVAANMEDGWTLGADLDALGAVAEILQERRRHSGA